MTRILYLHGFASSPASSKARFFAERLRAAGAEVEIPDLAEGDFEHLTLSAQLRLIERAAGPAPISLVGSSMGGYLAALYAARHPEVDRLVLLAPAFRFAKRWAERIGPAAVAAWRERPMEVFHYGEGRKRLLSHQLLEDGETYEDFPDFHQPALIFHGAHDAVVPAEYSQTFAANHPNAHLQIFDSGHELLNVLDLMAPQVCAFLA
jgi:pimeloyl-ACP methyl ester carboxylesterase